jgi:hypothetical protein
MTVNAIFTDNFVKKAIRCAKNDFAHKVQSVSSLTTSPGDKGGD